MENTTVRRALERYATSGRPVTAEADAAGNLTITMDEKDAERALADRDAAEKVGAAEVLRHLMEAYGPGADLVALEAALLLLAEGTAPVCAPRPPAAVQLRLGA
jgi:hypothetical protein